MVDAAVVTVCGLALLLLSSPPFYDLRVIEGGEGKRGTSPDMDHPQGTGKMGLYYYSYWRVKRWGLNSPCVSAFDCFIDFVLKLTS